MNFDNFSQPAANGFEDFNQPVANGFDNFGPPPVPNQAQNFNFDDFGSDSQPIPNIQTFNNFEAKPF